MPTLPDVKPDPIGTDEELQSYFSVYGIRSWTNHTETDDPDAPAEDLVADAYENALTLVHCKIFAGSYLASRLAKRYRYSDLDNCPMMVEIWCIIVLRTLCYRRGNPPPASLEFRYQEITQKDGLLDQIASGFLPLTDVNGLPFRPKNSNAPSWSNLQIDRFYPESKVRVVSGNSDPATSALPIKKDRFQEFN